MANEYFEASGTPTTSSRLASSAIRAEYASVEDGFDKLPVLLGNGLKIIRVNAGGTALEATSITGTGDVVYSTSPTLVTPVLGVASATSINKVTITAPATGATLTLADGSTFVTAGAFSVTFTATATTALTLPTTGTLSTLAGSETFTNKTITSPTITTPTIDGITAITDRIFTTGDVKLTFKTSADTGWVLMDDGTIGNASSSATTRANADTAALFTLLWTNTVDADCAVSGGRGASAAADYAANKRIALPKALGRALAGYGTGSGLTARALAHVVGEETHALTAGEGPAHTHTISGTYYEVAAGTPLNGSTVGAGSGTSGTFGSSLTADSTGSGTAHNTMQPTLFLNVMIKL